MKDYELDPERKITGEPGNYYILGTDIKVTW
jgi:hypothetical protein